MIRRRAYSTARSFRGRRLLDYVSPQTHAVVPRNRWLLTTRTGARYQNGTHPFNDRLELATVLALLLDRADAAPGLKQSVFDRLRPGGTLPAFEQQFRSGHDVFGAVLAREHSSPAELELWLRCVRAASLAEALAVVGAHPHAHWPAFVLLHLFGRRCTSPLDAYNAVRALQRLLPRVEPHYRAELLALCVRMAQRQLVDLVPVAVRVFVDASPAVGAAECNELLWQVARFGTRWSPADTPLLLEAQELLVQRAGVAAVDAKGVFALAYVTHFQQPAAARRAVDELAPVVAARAPPHLRAEFAYACGPLAMRILTAAAPEDAFAAVDAAAAAEGPPAQHMPMLWTCVCLHLARQRLLTRDVALRVLRKLGRAQVRLTALLAETLVGAVPDLATKQAMLDAVRRQGLRLTPALAARALRLGSATDLEHALCLPPLEPFLGHPRVLQQLLDTQSRVDPRSAWATYSRLRRATAPSREALRSLCRAAWDPTLLWDGVYAPQRALAEIKSHVRGVVAPPDDLMRVYPDARMVYSYVVMIGRAGYTAELAAVLGWMDALQFAPPKRVLLALIHYSPQGPALLKLGQKTRPPQSEWPTEEEYRLYAEQH